MASRKRQRGRHIHYRDRSVVDDHEFQAISGRAIARLEDPRTYRGLALSLPRNVFRKLDLCIRRLSETLRELRLDIRRDGVALRLPGMNAATMTPAVARRSPS